MRLFIIASVFLLVMAAANYYVYRRFFRRLAPALARYTAAVPVALMVGEILFVLDAALALFPDSPLLYTVNAVFVGCTFILLVVAILYDLTVTLSRHVPLAAPARDYLKVGFDALALALSVAYVAVGLAGAFSKPAVHPVDVSIKGLPFERYTIVQLSDLHVGPLIGRAFVADLVARTNALHPDLVVITGDLADESVERAAHALEPLKDLQARTYFVTGNHDYFHGPQRLVQYVRSLGITPLLNRSVLVGSAARGFDLVGINDLSGRRAGVLAPDIRRAYAGIDASRPVIVLAHQPKTLQLLEGRRCDLMISGHTHGGQIFPFGLLVMIGQPYLAGLHRNAQGQQIFVTRGTGFWGPPLRVLAPGEITRLILTPKRGR
ncbi:MAG TPA: metallophosphoesterase [Gammaproteobacteria bacterium]|nr:metallophosphoesterase [Gammaproteobacteria bacterium]